MASGFFSVHALKGFRDAAINIKIWVVQIIPKTVSPLDSVAMLGMQNQGITLDWLQAHVESNTPGAAMFRKSSFKNPQFVSDELRLVFNGRTNPISIVANIILIHCLSCYRNRVL